MTVQMGNRIRELRKSKNISQEVLAQYLGVTAQAVSKWETGTALPDVALVPVIASFFQVSTDELFDYNRMEAEKNVREICLSAYLCREHDPQKSEEILREGLRKYPGNDIILNNLLYTMCAEERSEEIITLCNTLIASTRDDSVKYDALRILAKTYHEIGQQDLVAPTLEQIPELYFSKLEYMARLLEGEDAQRAAQQHLWLCLEQMVDMAVILCNEFSRKGCPEQAGVYRRVAQQVTELFGRELGPNFKVGEAWMERLPQGENPWTEE